MRLFRVPRTTFCVIVRTRVAHAAIGPTLTISSRIGSPALQRATTIPPSPSPTITAHRASRPASRPRHALSQAFRHVWEPQVVLHHGWDVTAGDPITLASLADDCTPVSVALNDIQIAHSLRTVRRIASRSCSCIRARHGPRAYEPMSARTSWAPYDLGRVCVCISQLVAISSHIASIVHGT